eukprot:489381-Hanusia_phi.AAC.1
MQWKLQDRRRALHAVKKPLQETRISSSFPFPSFCSLSQGLQGGRHHESGVSGKLEPWKDTSGYQGEEAQAVLDRRR